MIIDERFLEIDISPGIGIDLDAVLMPLRTNEERLKRYGIDMAWQYQTTAVLVYLLKGIIIKLIMNSFPTAYDMNLVRDNAKKLRDGNAGNCFCTALPKNLTEIVTAIDDAIKFRPSSVPEYVTVGQKVEAAHYKAIYDWLRPIRAIMLMNNSSIYVESRGQTHQLWQKDASYNVSIPALESRIFYAYSDWNNGAWGSQSVEYVIRSSSVDDVSIPIADSCGAEWLSGECVVYLPIEISSSNLGITETNIYVPVTEQLSITESEVIVPGTTILNAIDRILARYGFSPPYLGKRYALSISVLGTPVCVLGLHDNLIVPDERS